MTQKQLKEPSFRFFRLTAKYANILLRLDMRDIMAILLKLEYKPLVSSFPASFKRYIGGKATLAKKAPDLTVDIDTDRGLIGLTTLHPPLAVKEYGKIERSIKKEIMPNLRIHYYEILAELLIKARKSPIKAFSELTRKTKLLEELGKKTGLKPAIFGLRIAPQGEIPDSPNWYDIEVIPHLVKPNKEYYVSIVYRSPNLKEIEDFIQNLQKIISILIHTIEENPPKN
ncbi:MAG: hypothetical protein J7J67_00655 [Thermoproteales archaeon]|nr:hypothetical protein [Thermoproteales archaeon]